MSFIFSLMVIRMMARQIVVQIIAWWYCRQPATELEWCTPERMGVLHTPRRATGDIGSGRKPIALQYAKP
jgi:hypothetical protein